MSLNVEFHFDPTLKFSWEASDIKTAIESISFLHGLPHVCPVCDAPIHFFFRSPKGYSYYGLMCEGSPKHEVNFGQHKEGGGLFYEGDGKWELEYSAREGGNQSSAPAAQPGSAAPSQPASQPSTATPKGDKAPMEKLNMIGAVARAKKVPDVDIAAAEILVECGLNPKKVNELTSDEADIVLSGLKARQ